MNYYFIQHCNDITEYPDNPKLVIKHLFYHCIKANDISEIKFLANASNCARFGYLYKLSEEDACMLALKGYDMKLIHSSELSHGSAW